MKMKRMVNVVGMHTGGERNDVITGGVLDVPGKTMFEKMRYLETQADDLRKFLLQEPRGTVTQCINLVLPPCDPQADAGFVIMESEHYPPMSGSNTICTVTALLETGMLPMQEPYTDLTLEAPGGMRPNQEIGAAVERAEEAGPPVLLLPPPTPNSRGPPPPRSNRALRLLSLESRLPARIVPWRRPTPSESAPAKSGEPGNPRLCVAAMKSLLSRFGREGLRTFTGPPRP